MDEIDLKLIKLLWDNPRSSYKDLADALDISTPAVHRRIQAARETGIILGPFVSLSPNFVQAINVVVFGKTNAGSLAEVMEGLKKDDSTSIVTMMSGNILLLRSILKDIDDLGRYMNFVRKAAQMPDPEIGIAPKTESIMAKEFDIKLTKVDVKIMCALRKDGRMSVNDIAEMIHVSPKTVRNHLHALIEKEIITLQIIANQADSGNFVPFIQIYLEKGKDKEEVIRQLRGSLFPPLVETNNYSNHLDMFTAYGWIQNMGQLRDLVAAIGKVDGIRAVIPNVFVESCSSCTWLHKLLDDPEKAMAFLQERKII